MTSHITAAFAAWQSIDSLFKRRGTTELVVRGKGDWVVFVPTFRQLSFVYMPLMETLADGWTTVLYAPTVSAHDYFGPKERAEELSRVLDIMDIDAAHLVGWSDAGSVITEFAKLESTRVTSRTYLGTPYQFVLPRGLKTLADVYARTSLDRWIPDVVAGSIIAFLMGSQAMPSRCLLRPISQIDGIAGFLKYSILPCIRYVNDVDRCKNSLVMAGDSDRFVHIDQMRALAQRLNARYVEISGGDHFLPWTSSVNVISTVREFLQEISAATT
jgi:pimeloyl-ACP methyl ester carboxylesterase